MASAAPHLRLAEADQRFLEKAVELGRKGWGCVHPNPMVGCVLVREGRIVAEGYHREFGGPHAETDALSRLEGGVDGVTALVSLEPCNHHGNTPPCSLALIDAGVKRVVFGAKDPGGESGGGCVTLLRAGVEVLGPAFSHQRSYSENPAFHHNRASGLPYVALKLAVSLDGMISVAPGRQKRITGNEAIQEVHRMRAGFDALMVGSNTARIDDPQLTVRGEVSTRVPPTRIVLDSNASLSPTSRMLSDDVAPVVVFVDDSAPSDRIRALEDVGARIERVPSIVAGAGLDLDLVLTRCSAMGIHSILCEGGGRLGAALIAERKLGRIYLFEAARAMGPDGVQAFPGVARPRPGWEWRAWGEKTYFGDDWLTILDPAL